MVHLLHALVETTALVILVLENKGSGENSLVSGLGGGSILTDSVEGFTDLHDIAELLGGSLGTAVETSLEVGDVVDLLEVGSGLVSVRDLDGEERSGEARSIREHHDALATELLGLVISKREEASVGGSGVHVSEAGGEDGSRGNLVLVSRLGSGGEGLFEATVGVALLTLNLGKLLHLSELLAVGVAEEVVVQKTAKRLLDELVVRGVEDSVVDVVEVEILTVVDLAVLLNKLGVAGIEGLEVADVGEVSIDNRVRGREVGLVKVIDVLHVRGASSTLDGEGSVGSDEHDDGTTSSSGTRRAFCVLSNIGGDDKSVASVPGRALNPREGVEEGVGSSVAGVHGVDTLDVRVTTLLEKLHEVGLGGLGVIEDGLGGNLEAADILVVDVVLFHEVGDGREADGVNVLVVLHESEFGLTETDGVLSGGDVVIFLCVCMKRGEEKGERKV